MLAQGQPRVASHADDVEGVETWEALQGRQRDLKLRTELKRVDNTLDEVQAWEEDLEETWPDMRVRLETQLKSNSLDHENKPFSGLTANVGPEGKTTDGRPTTIIWQNGPNPDEDGENPKQNSDHLQLAVLKHWGLEMPTMALIVHGGSAHPWQLIRVQQMADQVCLAPSMRVSRNIFPSGCSISYARFC